MPTNENGTVLKFACQPTPPARRRNCERRPREHLTPAEIGTLVETAKRRGRYGARDAAAILIAYSHGLRVSELVALTWAQIDFADGVIHVNRLKNGRPSTQPLRGAELRALRQLRRDWPEGRFVFQSERGTPMTAAGFRKTLARIGEAAGFPWLSTRTSCATLPATRSPTGASTRAPCSIISATARSSTRSVIANSPPIGSRDCGTTDECLAPRIPRARFVAGFRERLARTSAHAAWHLSIGERWSQYQIAAAVFSHANIQCIVRYKELAAGHFAGWLLIRARTRTARRCAAQAKPLC